MKILNWNTYNRNREIKQALSFVFRQQAEIVCLQEVTIKGLRYLKKWRRREGYQMLSTLDIEESNPLHRGYLVILTRFPINHKRRLRYYRKKVWSWYRWYRRLVYHEDSKPNALSVELDSPLGKIRVHNLHLDCYTGPKTRIEQFQNFVRKVKLRENDIICGDLNTFGEKFCKWASFLPFSYGIDEVLINEREEFDKIIKKHQLQNPYWKEKSCPGSIFSVQLDYILFSEKWQLKEKGNFQKTFGSDHLPQMVAVATEARAR